ncbi:MAG: hypothetical protein ACFB0B_06000 [Thermonemataceae bacterium]
MPAKKKYLSGSWKRFSKVTAAILGGFIATMLLHVAIIKRVPYDAPALMTAAYSSFIVWVGFMILTYFIHKAWQVWCLLGAISLMSALVIYL